MSAVNAKLEVLIEEMLNRAATHAFDTDDREAYLCGAEFGGRYVLQEFLRSIMEAWDELSLPLNAEMSE